MTRLVFAALVLLPFAAGSQDDSVCRDSARISRLARIDASPDAAMVGTQSDVWCATKEARPTVMWPNGHRARLSNGAWDYPSGRTARSLSGLWFYASGRPARATSGSWHYPDGRIARSASGRWQRPDGVLATEQELLLWACQRLGESRCKIPLTELGALAAFDKELAILELAWSAR